MHHRLRKLPHVYSSLSRVRSSLRMALIVNALDDLSAEATHGGRDQIKAALNRCPWGFPGSNHGLSETEVVESRRP